MESAPVEKKSKTNKLNAYTTLSIRKETKKKINADLARLNKERIGRMIRYDEYLALAVTLITQDHLQQLQENSMTHTDRLKRDYLAYVAKFGPVSEDEYLGKRLSGEITQLPKTSIE